MKNLFLILTLFFISQNLFTQTNERVYKKFSDSIFEEGDKILAPEIYFTLSGGSRVIEKHQDSVKIIADFLKTHPNIKLELGVHTDSRGSSTANVKLSEHRGGSVKFELVQRFGIESERVTIKGYGESDLIISDNEIEQVNTRGEKEKLHQINRRIELKIIK